jgi:hypothetical protein
VIGGWTPTNNWCPALSHIEQFDPIAHTWTSLGTDGIDRGDAACAEMHGHLYIIGGERKDCNATAGTPNAIGIASIVSHVEIFDPVTQSFDQLAPVRDGPTLAHAPLRTLLCTHAPTGLSAPPLLLRACTCERDDERTLR